MRFSNKTDSSAICWWKRFGWLCFSWLSSTFKSCKKVFCLLAYIIGLFKTPFIELALSSCIDCLGHCTVPSLPIPSFLTATFPAALSFIHHLTPLQTDMSSHAAQHSGQCSLHYRAQEKPGVHRNSMLQVFSDWLVINYPKIVTEGLKLLNSTKRIKLLNTVNSKKDAHRQSTVSFCSCSFRHPNVKYSGILCALVYLHYISKSMNEFF